MSHGLLLDVCQRRIVYGITQSRGCLRNFSLMFVRGAFVLIQLIMLFTVTDLFFLHFLFFVDNVVYGTFLSNLNF